MGDVEEFHLHRRRFGRRGAHRGIGPHAAVAEDLLDCGGLVGAVDADTAVDAEPGVFPGFHDVDGPVRDALAFDQEGERLASRARVSGRLTGPFALQGAPVSPAEVIDRSRTIGALLKLIYRTRTASERDRPGSTPPS
jgi:hypothetical protein